MSILLHKIYLVKWSTKGLGGSKCPKNYPHGLWMTLKCTVVGGTGLPPRKILIVSCQNNFLFLSYQYLSFLKIYIFIHEVVLQIHFSVAQHYYAWHHFLKKYR